MRTNKEAEIFYEGAKTGANKLALQKAYQDGKTQAYYVCSIWSSEELITRNFKYAETNKENTELNEEQRAYFQGEWEVYGWFLEIDFGKYLKKNTI